MYRRWAALAALLLLTGADARAAAPAAEPAALLRRADASRDAFNEGVIGLRVIVNERGEKPVSSVLQLFVKGADQSLLVFKEGKQKGRKILTLGERVFLIVPGASRPIPVSKTQRLMGAASFGDIARLRLVEQYEATLRPEEQTLSGEVGTTRCDVLDLAAKKVGSAYPTAVLWVGRDDALPRRLLLSLASGKEAKDVRFTSYDNKGRVAAMDIRDLLNTGGANVTSLKFESYEERPLDPAIFDPEGARAVASP
jgi:hypothetical protein